MENRAKLEAMARDLREAGWGVVPPENHLSDMDAGFLHAWKAAKPYTMISPERAWALAEAVRYISRAGIPGDIAECGVWKGGACLLASTILFHEDGDSARTIWLYDTFSGMVSPGKEDCIAVSGQPLSQRHPEGWWAAGLDEVKQTLKLSPFPMNRFRFVPGRVENSLNREVPSKLALLRLDTDWYASTMKELEVLYPSLSPGGVLLIDDYGHFTGARKAVDDYFAGLGETLLLHRNDYTGRAWIKRC